MTQNQFIKDFVQKYPRLYVRFISHYFPFTFDDLVKYKYILSWGNYGVEGNKNIIWNDDIRNFFKKDIYNINLFEKTNSECKLPLINSNKCFISYKDGRFQNSIEIEDIDLAFLRRNKEYVRDWGSIATYFKKINYDFLLEFEEYIKPHIGYIIYNNHVDWCDTRLFEIVGTNFEILNCNNIWDNFLKKLISRNNIDVHLNSMNELKKIGKITFKSEIKSDGSFKYLMAVYIRDRKDYQMLSSGYFYSTKDISIGMECTFDVNHKFPIGTGHSFNFIKIVD